eukprot:6472966-Amphidinium_carterae.1
MDANQAAFGRSQGRSAVVDEEFTAEAGWLQSGSGHTLHCIAPMDVHQCTGFMVNAQRLAGRLQLWSHGSWTTQASDLELNERDAAWHPPSFLHFQSVGIPPGYRRRSAAATEARNQKFRDRNKASNRWGGQTSGNPSSSTGRWGGRDDHFQERWSGYGRTSS